MTITDFLLENFAHSGSWTIYAALLLGAAVALSEWLGSRPSASARRPGAAKRSIVSRGVV